MRLLFLYAQLGEPIEDFVSFDFQLPRQLVNPNLLHREKLSANCCATYLFVSLALVRFRALGRRGAFRTISLGRVVSGERRVIYRTKLFRLYFVFGLRGRGARLEPFLGTLGVIESSRWIICL